MTTETDDLTKTQHEFRRRRIAAGEARCAMFRRIYDAAIEDVWDACTNGYGAGTRRSKGTCGWAGRSPRGTPAPGGSPAASRRAF